MSWQAPPTPLRTPTLGGSAANPLQDPLSPRPIQRVVFPIAIRPLPQAMVIHPALATLGHASS